MNKDAQWIKGLRNAQGLTQKEFSDTYGISIDSLRNWEQGRFRPDRSLRNYLIVIEHAPKKVQKILRDART